MCVLRRALAGNPQWRMILLPELGGLRKSSQDWFNLGHYTAGRRQAHAHGITVDLRIMDVVEMRFPKKSFQNVLFSFNGFEQIPGKKNRRQALQNMFDVLASDGP